MLTIIIIHSLQSQLLNQIQTTHPTQNLTPMPLLQALQFKYTLFLSLLLKLPAAFAPTLLLFLLFYLMRKIPHHSPTLPTLKNLNYILLPLLNM